VITFKQEPVVAVAQTIANTQKMN